MTAWLDRRFYGLDALRPTTLAEYRRLSVVIIDAIGGERLRDVTADTLDDLERFLHKNLPGRATTHARVYAIIRSALRDAVRRGALADDPTRRREPIRAPKTRRQMLQPEQFGRLLDWMHAHGERMAPVFQFAVMTGLRRGEIAGLRWVDVSLDAAAHRRRAAGRATRPDGCMWALPRRMQARAS
jgi:integrase